MSGVELSGKRRVRMAKAERLTIELAGGLALYSRSEAAFGVSRVETGTVARTIAKERAEELTGMLGDAHARATLDRDELGFVSRHVVLLITTNFPLDYIYIQ